MAGARTWRQLEAAIHACDRCPRLRAHCAQTARTKRRAYRDETYWGRPVAGFGDRRARILLVGLAPGAHGANRTGRMFTGDSSGDFLYASLHRLGLANQPTATSRDDGLVLRGVWIGASARCAPPDNRPAPAEIEACRPFLHREIDLLGDLRVLVALGGIAWENLRRLFLERLGETTPQPRFGHGALWRPGPPAPPVLGSYHPSRQNTQTGRLTPPMLDRVLVRARALAGMESEDPEPTCRP